MAITVAVAATVNAASGAGTQFTAAGPFALYGDNFGANEHAALTRLGPSGSYFPVMMEGTVVSLSGVNNTVLIPIAGTYRLEKQATAVAASIGYEVQP